MSDSVTYNRTTVSERDDFPWRPLDHINKRDNNMVVLQPA